MHMQVQQDRLEAYEARARKRAAKLKDQALWGVWDSKVHVLLNLTISLTMSCSKTPCPSFPFSLFSGVPAYQAEQSRDEADSQDRFSGHGFTHMR